jgi:cytochrome P450
LNGADLTTKEQMDALPYLKACIRESHRLTPATVVVTKTLEEDIDIVDGTNSYHVPAGKRILLNNRGIPMDPKYVSNPTLYEPERFLPDAIAARKGTPAQIIDHPSFGEPFGRGKRRCLGANVANAEIMILAARLFQDWEIGLKDGTAEWKASQKLMLKADPYPNMTVIPRV